MNKNVLPNALSILACALAFGAMIKVLTIQPNDAPLPAPVAHDTPMLDLDCNRPQGHHVWTGELITPQDDPFVLRVSTGDQVEDINVKGWLCVISSHIAKVS